MFLDDLTGANDAQVFPFTNQAVHRSLSHADLPAVLSYWRILSHGQHLDGGQRAIEKPQEAFMGVLQPILIKRSGRHGDSVMDEFCSICFVEHILTVCFKYINKDFREIMDISVTTAGAKNITCPEGKWMQHGEKGVMYSAFYAGTQMYALKIEEGDYSGLWELRYKGHKMTALLDADEAMSYGSLFSKDILEKLKEKDGSHSTAVVSSDPISDLSNLIDLCDANPHTVSKMKALIAMIRDETETLREGVLALNPEEQLSREASLLDRMESLSQTIKKAL